MITIEPVVSPTIPMRTHISLLSNEAIDQLVSQSIFQLPATCQGFLEPSMKAGLLRCTACDALIPATDILDANGEAKHPRSVPYFSTSMAPAWSVVDCLRRESEMTQICFALFLDVLIRDEVSLKHPLRRVQYSLQRYTFGINPRLICIAALQAVDAVDIDGYVVESEGE